MSKRFNISLEEILEVDKVSEEAEDKKEAPQSEKVLDTVVAEAEKEEEAKDEPPIVETTEDAPVEVAKDETTVDGSEVQEEETKEPEEEVKEESEVEETSEEEEENDDEGDSKDTFSMSDIADSIKEEEANDDEVEVATEAAITLESIANELEASIDNGGMSETTAAITDIAVRNICERVGIVPKEFQEIAVENFKTPSSRIRHTKIAIENIGEYLLKLWEAFIQSIKRGIEWIKSFIDRLFNEYQRFSRQIKNLKDAVTKMPDDKIDLTGKVFTEISVIKNLKVNQSVEVAKAVDTLRGFTKLYYSLVKKQKEKQFNNLKDIIDSVIKGSFLPSVIEVQPIESFDIVKSSLDGYVAPENTQSYISKDILPGNTRFLAFYPRDDLHLDVEKDIEKYNTSMGSCNFSIVVDITNNSKEVTSTPVIDKAALLVIVTNLEALCKQALDSKPIFETFIKEKIEINKKLEVLIKERNQKSKFARVSDRISDLAGREKDKVSEKDIFMPIKVQFTLMKQTYENGSSQLSTLIHKTIKSSIYYVEFCIQENLNVNKKKIVTP